MIKMGLAVIGLLMGVQGWAQDGYVVPSGAGVRDGSSWENAWGSLEEALQSGKRKIAARWGTYRVERELIVPVGVELKGGYATDGTLQPGGAEQTVLLGAGRSRVIRVRGVLDGFTVCDGRVTGDDGGGIYVENGGTVRNCIVRNNIAGRYYPKVGDVQLLDGSFLPGEQVTAEDASDVRGIVFWINPDPAAPEGKRGWIVAKEVGVTAVSSWVKDEESKAAKNCVTGVSFDSPKEAMGDTAGWIHTQEVVKAGLRSQCTLVDEVLIYGNKMNEPGRWYVPAMGQLVCLMREFMILNEIWKKLNPGDAQYVKYMVDGALFSSSEAVDESSGSASHVWSGVVGGTTGWGKVESIGKVEGSGGSSFVVAVASF